MAAPCCGGALAQADLWEPNDPDTAILTNYSQGSDTSGRLLVGFPCRLAPSAAVFQSHRSCPPPTAAQIGSVTWSTIRVADRRCFSAWVRKSAPP